MFQQHRHRSTFLSRRTYITQKSLVRYVWTLPTHRRLPYDPLRQLKSRENLQQIVRIKSHLRNVAKSMASKSSSEEALQKSDNEQSPPKSQLSHLTSAGEAHMIDVGQKKETHRSATAVCRVMFSSPVTFTALVDATLQKGDALAVARIAGIQAAKKTSDLIPLAHPGLGITAVRVDLKVFRPFGTSSESHLTPSTEPIPSSASVSTELEVACSSDENAAYSFKIRSKGGGVHISATVECWGKTGVEMEALTAANVAALTMYDMLKGIDKGMTITGSRVVEKRGGKSGGWRWNKHTKRVESLDQVDGRIPSENQYRPPAPERSESGSKESNPQFLLEEEWNSLAQSFHNTQPRYPSAATEFSDETNEDSEVEADSEVESETLSYKDLGCMRLRDHLSGAAPLMVDREDFRNVRQERWEEWWRNH